MKRLLFTVSLSNVGGITPSGNQILLSEDSLPTPDHRWVVWGMHYSSTHPVYLSLLQYDPAVPAYHTMLTDLFAARLTNTSYDLRLPIQAAPWVECDDGHGLGYAWRSYSVPTSTQTGEVMLWVSAEIGPIRSSPI